MRDIPAQLHNIRRTTMGDTIIAFTVDEMYTDTVQELFLKKMGTEFVMKLEDVTSSTVLGGKSEEVNEDTHSKFWKSMHAKINELANLRDEEPEQVKELLKTELKKKGLIKESTKELDIKGLAIALNLLTDWIKELQ